MVKMGHGDSIETNNDAPKIFKYKQFQISPFVDRVNVAQGYQAPV